MDSQTFKYVLFTHPNNRSILFFAVSEVKRGETVKNKETPIYDRPLHGSGTTRDAVVATDKGAPRADITNQVPNSVD